MSDDSSSQKPRKILEIIDNDNVITRFYVSIDESRRKFMLYLVSDVKMTDDDIVSLVGMFVDERDGLPLDGSDFGDQTH